MKTTEQIQAVIDSLKKQKTDYQRIIKSCIRDQQTVTAIHAGMMIEKLDQKIEMLKWVMEETPY